MTGRVERRLSSALVAAVIAQALLGRLAPGAYRDVEWIRATWIGNDLVTLLVAAPILVASGRATARGSARARLVWLGVLGYAVYNYAFYLLGAALNAFFPLYVVSFVLALATFVAALAGTDVGSIAGTFARRTPVRALGSYYAFVAAGLSVVWLGTWAAYVSTGRPTPVAPDAFRLVAALDLALMVPALAAGGVLLWRRRPWGYVVAATAGIQATLYLSVLSINSVIAVRLGLVEFPGELPTWAPLLALTLAATALLVAASGRQLGQAPDTTARRRSHEDPAVVTRRGWRYHHLGIPHTTARPDEEDLPHLGVHVSGFGTSPYGIEWMRFDAACDVPEVVRHVPHLAFVVDDLDAALEGKTLLIAPNSPSPGVRVAFILDDGAPVELLEFTAGPDR